MAKMLAENKKINCGWQARNAHNPMNSALSEIKKGGKVNMSSVKKKTLGIAIASLVCGCLILIPLLGAILAIAALTLGIIALVKISKNKETLKGQGLAIAGIVLGSIGIILIPIIALLSAIAIPNFLRARMNASNASAEATLRALSTAAESYATVNKGEYPLSVFDLTTAEPPYLSRNYLAEPHQGYKFTCDFNPSSYECKATPETCGTTGTKIYIIKAGGEISQSDCYDSD
ncbi:MAG: DUF4190 domain-containing protein [Candidatus Omnitrophica bacterium]|nr:DUF4190 domain-containing protein [Candidatus Omnitrophota bacterium]MBU0896978.1 DUF4190 domain-containing protein [Candidatus Omnitrophota bacterium]MBU1134045.1 DUF4190 domain-containing protein [Candidatus Omnitrophota bacterium]MBU1367633.1 DUF4190 domain-containing protein [Candidatus Omnitrophota bacterium]MBU1523590.1 DUF4190 domain-containing protein [Candidatus Omnitrophota bacterium]